MDPPTLARTMARVLGSARSSMPIICADAVRGTVVAAAVIAAVAMMLRRVNVDNVMKSLPALKGEL